MLHSVRTLYFAAIETVSSFLAGRPCLLYELNTAAKEHCFTIWQSTTMDGSTTVLEKMKEETSAYLNKDLQKKKTSMPQSLIPMPAFRSSMSTSIQQSPSPIDLIRSTSLSLGLLLAHSMHPFSCYSNLLTAPSHPSHDLAGSRNLAPRHYFKPSDTLCYYQSACSRYHCPWT